MKLARQQTDKVTRATLTGKQWPAFLRIIAISILTSALAVLALATASFAQPVPPTFVNPTLFNGGSVINNYSPIPVNVLAIGDFNNDGIPDFLTLDDNGNTAGVGIMLGTGNGGFTPVTQIFQISCTLEGGITVGDFNNDGNLDFAIVYGTPGGDCNFNPGTLSIFLGNGAGGFTAKASYSELGGPAYHDAVGGLITADLRGNGHLDLLAIDPNNGIDVFLGNGDGTFVVPTAAVGIPSPGNSNSLAVADLNHDGKQDVVVASNNSGDGIYVLLGNGDGTLQTPVFYQQGSNSGAMSIAIGALTKTSHGDVVMGAGNGLYVYLNNGDGTFKTPPAYFAGPAWATSVVLVDVNGDKKLDAVASSFTSSSVWVLLGNGKGGFGPGLSFASNGRPNNVVVADFNGDKKVDFATSNNDGQWVTVALGNGDGTFRSSQGYGYGWNAAINAIATADLNGDGYPDIVTGGGGTGVGIAVQLGGPHGTLSAPVSYAAGCGEANRSGINSIALGDVNGDKKIDIVATSLNDPYNCDENVIAVLLGLGNGKFKPVVYYPTGSTQQSYSATLANLRGKGVLDIVVSNGDGSISVLLNNGKGVFGAANVIPAASGTEGGSIVIGDFNNDGKVDIAVTNYSGTAINILLGNGDGTFQAPIVNPSPIPPVGMSVGDFNKDGKLDIALTSWDNGQNDGGGFTVFLGNGNGTLTIGTTYNFSTWEQCYPSGGSNPYWIGTADLNQDGNPDLAIATTYSECGTEYSGDNIWGEALVYTGNGDGTFTLDDGPWLAGGLGATGIALADFNGDGMTDMAVATTALWTTQEWVSIIQNKTQPVSVSPLSMTFKAQTMGTKSKAQTVVFTNDEANTLSISGVSLGGTDPGDFGFTSACKSTLLAGANCTISVTFTPTATGKRTATLQISDGAGTQSVALTGTGK